ncbi:Sodium/hydrogen exchanger 9B2, partial [Gryllus bimaculatus]
VAEHFRAAWAVFQTLLFALIGAEVDVAAMQPLHVALGAAALAVALAARIAVTVLIAFGADLTWKEKLFLSFAWFPKATVQNLNSIGNSNEGFDNVPEDSATGRFESQSNGQTPTSAGVEDTESANG